MEYDCSVTKRKGCNYCLCRKALSNNTFEDVTIYDEDKEMRFDFNLGNYSSGITIKINYCPICGKKLD
jgi:hypothetical protein